MSGDLTTLLPHRPPMRLAERLLSREGDVAVCVGRIDEQNPLAHAGEASAILAIELAAQASIAFARTSSAGGGKRPVPIGYLVAIRSATFHQSKLPVGVELRARVERLGGAGALQRFAVRVMRAFEPHEVLAEATISTFATQDAIEDRD